LLVGDKPAGFNKTAFIQAPYNTGWQLADGFNFFSTPSKLYWTPTAAREETTTIYLTFFVENTQRQHIY
jgi:hypothetical protein